MHTHNPSCLEGPISGSREWWRTVMNNADLPSDSACKEPLFRAALVEQVRREIAAGTYDTEEKWEIALDRLLARLESEDA
jgi:hypothetical protein